MERIHRSIPLDSRETGVEGNMLKRLNCSSRLDHLGVHVLFFPQTRKDENERNKNYSNRMLQQTKTKHAQADQSSAFTELSIRGPCVPSKGE